MSTFGLAFTAALVDFVWQGTVVALALLAALHTVGRRSAQVRYGLCLIAMATLLAMPVITTASRFEVAESIRGARVTDGPTTVVTDTSKGLAVDLVLRSTAAPSIITTLQPWILPVWSLGVLLLSLRLVAGGLEVRALRRTASTADDSLREHVTRIALRMGLRRPVQVVTSTRADGPSVIAWLRPLVLLPPATLMGLTTTQLDAVLAHELAHIRRHDYLINIIQMVAETLLFYHPAVWWVSSRLRIERELCCDDEAVRVCGDATAYAKALVTMAKHHVPAMAMGSTGGSLTDRVRRLLGAGRPEPRRSAAGACVVIFVAISVAGMVGQTSAARAAAGLQHFYARAFEVVSIKPNTSGQPVGVAAELLQLMSDGRFLARNVTLKQLVLLGYRSDVTGAHVSGGPDWIDKERFDVEATTPPGAVPPTLTGRARAQLLEQMMQAMLADRFKLRLRREVRDADVYALVVARGGPKLVSAKTQRCLSTTDQATRCHVMGGGVNRGLQGEGIDTDDIAAFLQTAVLTPERVVNRTGIAGLFDVNVTWRRSENARPNPNGPNAGQPADPDGPDVFTALQEQIGLRLQRQKAGVNFVIIESAGRPSDN
jgi:uncharacterized protein (TIGR03435 family)